MPVRTTTRVVEINDVDGLARELAHEDVAVCVFEPALTNIGIVLPDPGYWEAVREICDRTGTLLLIDETHTLSAGPGGRDPGVGALAGPRDDREDPRRRHPLARPTG